MVADKLAADKAIVDKAVEDRSAAKKLSADRIVAQNSKMKLAFNKVRAVAESGDEITQL